MTVSDLEKFLATYSHRTTTDDLNPANLAPAGINLDLGKLALNAARRLAERIRDWRASETTAFLSIPTAGGSLTDCYPTAALTGTKIGIKRIRAVTLPIASSEYQPVEFMTEDAFNNRTRMQIGRRTFDNSKTLAQIGVQSGNPLAYQSGQTLRLYPITATTVARLTVTRWLADYTTGADSDWMTLYAPEYLQWQGLLELNKLFRVYIPKHESNIADDTLKGMADAALASMIAWDDDQQRTTTTPIQSPK